MKKMKFMALAMFMAATATSFIACDSKSDSKNDESADKSAVVVGDTTERKAVGHTPSTNIRYVDMDSILSNYTYAQQESQKIQQKAAELQQYQNTLAATLQKRANEIQQKVQSNGYLTQQSYETDMNELNKLDQSSSKQYATRAQAFETEAAKVQQNIINAIRNFIIDYNKTKKYDAILFKDSGIFFNPELDITKEILDGLNAAATPAAK